MDELSHLQAMRPWGYCDVSVSLSVNADVGLEWMSPSMKGILEQCLVSETAEAFGDKDEHWACSLLCDNQRGILEQDSSRVVFETY